MMFTISYIIFLKASFFLGHAYTTHSMYGKVHPEFPSDFEDNYIRTVKNPAKLPFLCPLECERTPQCDLYCMEGTSCRLYSVPVTVNWQGPEEYGQSVAHSFSKCMSLMAVPDEVMHQATVNGHSSFSYENKPEKMINGYYSSASFHAAGTKIGTTLWYKADLGRPYHIRRLILHTPPKNMRLLNVQFGMASDYSSNPVIVTTSSTYRKRRLDVTFNIPVYGQYLYIDRLIGSHHYIKIGSLVLFKA